MFGPIMALLESQFQKSGFLAPDFHLKGTIGGEGIREFSLADFASNRALVVMFMCNHCPYVIAVRDRIEALAQEFSARGVALIGINPNDPVRYPADSFENMVVNARENHFTFPYLIDETQTVARAYGAVCTPDPYLFENVGGQFRLYYQGRIDDSWKDPSKVTRRELAEAIESVLAEQKLGFEPKPSMGCSIKWKG